MTSLFTREGILSLIISIPGLLLAVSMHECAHGYAAYFMGDPTAKYNGRLSLNPLRHLDLVGTLCMLLFRFGWAKPVPIDSRYFKNRKLGIILVSLAGPFANFIIGFISAVLYYAVAIFTAGSQNILWSFLVDIFQISAIMNAGFMIFNLIPLPPLDGSKILFEFLPYRLRYQIYRYERYFSLILLLVIYTGAITPVLGSLRQYVIMFYEICCQLIFSMFI